MNNPFDVIDVRLSNIEKLLLDIKHCPALHPSLPVNSVKQKLQESLVKGVAGQEIPGGCNG